jgi:TrmH family RNA methyltransferase
MTPETVTSASNATVKLLRSLAQKKHRREHGLFLAEGLRICTEALDSGWTPRILAMAQGERHHPLARRLAHATLGAGGRVIEVSPDLLSSLTGKDNPQAVLAAFPTRPFGLEGLATAPLYLAAQAVRDPGNLGTMLRTCDAVGAGGLILVGDCVDPDSVEAVRASMGARFTVPVARTDLPGLLGWRDATGARLVGAALADTATDWAAETYAPPTIILVGNEQAGLPDDHVAACDALVKMPMRGRADSVNVAVAAAVLLYRALDRQRGSTRLRPAP